MGINGKTSKVSRGCVIVKQVLCVFSFPVGTPDFSMESFRQSTSGSETNDYVFVSTLKSKNRIFQTEEVGGFSRGLLTVDG